MPSSFPLLRLALLVGGFGCGRLAAADPLAELRAASDLPGVDTGRLLRGEIITGRGTEGTFPRGVYAESCYYVKAPVDTVQTTLLHWNPAKYKETEVSAYQTYHWPAAPEVFAAFQLRSKIPADRTLIDWTAEVGRGGDPGELHLRPEDAKTFRRVLGNQDSAHAPAREGMVNGAWQGLLQARSTAVGSGGFAALPAYQANGVTIRAADEFKSLLRMAPKVAGRFAPLATARPLSPEGPATLDEVAPYAEQSLVRGHTSFCLGVIGALRTPTGWQALDCTYYTADTFFVSMALYQMWPWEDGTLVWEIDYASAPFRSYLGGIDRVFAGKEMTKDSAGAVQTFRKEIAGQQGRR